MLCRSFNNKQIHWINVQFCIHTLLERTTIIIVQVHDVVKAKNIEYL